MDKENSKKKFSVSKLFAHPVNRNFLPALPKIVRNKVRGIK